MFVIVLILHRTKLISAVFSILQIALHIIAKNYANNDENNIWRTLLIALGRDIMSVLDLRVDRRFDETQPISDEPQLTKDPIARVTVLYQAGIH